MVKSDQPQYSAAAALALWRHAAAGDQTAFETLYRQYLVPVYRYIFLRTGHRQTAEDLTQTVFVKAWQALPTLTVHSGHPLAYFFAIAKTTVIDYHRKKKEVLVDDPEESFGHLADESADAATLVDQQLTRQTLLDAIKHLPDSQQQVITWRFLDQLTTEEISTLTGKSPAAIRQLQCRALKKLRQLLTP